jgi:prevent-host-death family protein
MAKEIAFTDARARLSDLLDEIGARHEHIVITRNGRTAAVLMSPEEYESIQETLDILQDEETMSALRRSAEDVAAGRVHRWDEVRRELGLA